MLRPRSGQTYSPITCTAEIEPVAVRAAGGDMEALGVLYDFYSGKVTKFFRDRTADRHLVEDLAHDTWIKVARAMPSWKPERCQDFGAWLHRITERVWYDRGRGLLSCPDPLLAEHDDMDSTDAEPTPDACYEHVSVKDAIWTSVANLPVAQAEVVTLLFGKGLSIQETASRLGKTPGAIRKAQHDALVALRRRAGIRELVAG